MQITALWDSPSCQPSIAWPKRLPCLKSSPTALQKDTTVVTTKVGSRFPTKVSAPFCGCQDIRAVSWQNQQTDMCAQWRQISLGIRPVWSESSLCAQRVAKDPSFLHADSEDSDQTGQMPRLIWVFAGRTCHFVGFVTRRLIVWAVQVCSIQIHMPRR